MRGAGNAIDRPGLVRHLARAPDYRCSRAPEPYAGRPRRGEATATLVQHPFAGAQPGGRECEIFQRGLWRGEPAHAPTAAHGGRGTTGGALADRDGQPRERFAIGLSLRHEPRTLRPLAERCVGSCCRSRSRRRSSSPRAPRYASSPLARPDSETLSGGHGVGAGSVGKTRADTGRERVHLDTELPRIRSVVGWV